jgi:hypothetical protein
MSPLNNSMQVERPVSFQQRRKFNRDMLRTIRIEIAHDEKTRCLGF